MKVLVSATFLLLSIIGYSNIAKAQEEVQVKPVDVYISGFGGYSFPLKTDISFPGLTLSDVKLDNSPSVGGKIGMWITAPRKTFGFDVGVEVDVTNYNPDASAGQVLSSSLGPAILLSTLDLNATYFGMNVLARLPMGITSDLPNGRWFPYIGVGGGAQRLTAKISGVTNEGRDTAPAFQALGGVKVFITKHFAAFVEGKFIHASHTFETGIGEISANLNSVHGVGGLSAHF